jgi:hypothetical protein
MRVRYVRNVEVAGSSPVTSTRLGKDPVTGFPFRLGISPLTADASSDDHLLRAGYGATI